MGIIGYAGLCNISNSVLIEGLEALSIEAMTCRSRRCT